MYVRKDGTPYYIGKGKPRRPYDKRGRPCKTPPKERIIILHTSLDENTAFQIEKDLIKLYGRKDLDPENGLLRNRSDGGEGVSGRINTEATKEKMRLSAIKRGISRETRRKIAQSKRGKKLSEKAIQKLRERRHTKETKEKMRNSHLGIKKTPEHRRAITKSKTGEKNPMYGTSKSYSFMNEEMGLIEKDITVKEMCEKYNLKSCGLYQLKNKKVLKYKNWVLM